MTQTEEISHDVRRYAAERGVFCASRPDYRAANAVPAAPRTKRNLVSRLIALLYGLACSVVFFHTFPYAIGFVSGLVVPKTIDTGTFVPIAEAFTVNLLLMSVFAIQHSVMARKQFKQWWTRFVPKSVERSTYVLFASLALILLFRQWRPMRAVVWHIEDPQTAMALIGLSCAGWLIVLTSTFLINHSSCSDCIKSPIISLDARCRRRISVPRFTTRSSGIRSISVSSSPFGRRR